MTNPILGPWQREPTAEEARALMRNDVSGTFELMTRPKGKPGQLHRLATVWEMGREHPPVKGCLVEAVGAQPFRTKVKRRKACPVGKSASGDKAQYLLEPEMYWRRDGCEIQVSYSGRSAGFRSTSVGLRTKRQRPTVQQKSDHCVIPEGPRKGSPIQGFENLEEGRR